MIKVSTMLSSEVLKSANYGSCPHGVLALEEWEIHINQIIKQQSAAPENVTKEN